MKGEVYNRLFAEKTRRGGRRRPSSQISPHHGDEHNRAKKTHPHNYTRHCRRVWDAFRLVWDAFRLVAVVPCRVGQYLVLLVFRYRFIFLPSGM